MLSVDFIVYCLLKEADIRPKMGRPVYIIIVRIQWPDWYKQWGKKVESEVG